MATVDELRQNWPALPVMRCGQLSTHAPHHSTVGPDQPRICPGRLLGDAVEDWRKEPEKRVVASPVPAEPATPAEVLRRLVELIDPGPLSPFASEAQIEVRRIAEMAARWADELDASRSTVPGPAPTDGETVESLTEAAGWIRDERDEAEDALAEVLRLLDRLDESGQDYDTDLIRGVIPAAMARRVLLTNAPELPGPAPTMGVLAEIAAERRRQDEKWGEQNHPDGTGPRVPYAGRLCFMEEAARDARLKCKGNTPAQDNWRDILLEEVFEALAEADPVKLRVELVQVGAVAAQWVEAIDRRPLSLSSLPPGTEAVQ